VVLLASLYTHSWAYKFDTANPIKSLAENYLTPFCNRDIKTRASLTLELMKHYHANGYIFHSNRSCKASAFGLYDIIKVLQETTGIPGLGLEADMGDPRFFSEEQFKMRLEAYLELLDAESLRGGRT
jgi:benzoyl-CoA reductase/2-hydroxyglutaryl-CoA dehydratase subunit BcrC/BadD/HgdB